MAENGRRRWRLVLIPAPLQGHITPMLHLATALHSKGFSITIAHSKLNPPDPSNHPDFVFHPLADNLSGTNPSSGLVPFLQALNSNCRGPLQEYLVQMMDEQQEKSEKESVVVIHDGLMFFAGSVAGDLGFPAIVLHSSNAAFVPAYQIMPRLHLEGRFLCFQDSMLQDIVPEIPPFRYKDLPFIGLPMQERLELVSVITPKSCPSASIFNTLEFLEESALAQVRKYHQAPIFTIGPLHKTAVSPSTSFLEVDTGCISWLDKQAPKSVIYVSLGSLATMDEKVFAEMAWGLVNSKQPFLWVVRPGSVLGFKWTECLPDSLMEEINDRGLIIKWAPQKEVLAHGAVGGFWSHCGWNSTLKSISEGVPMLCQPLSADQGLDARYISYVWKIGLEIDEERGVIERAIRRLLVEKEGEEMRRRALEVPHRREVDCEIPHRFSRRTKIALYGANTSSIKHVLTPHG